MKKIIFVFAMAFFAVTSAFAQVSAVFSNPPFQSGIRSTEVDLTAEIIANGLHYVKVVFGTNASNLNQTSDTVQNTGSGVIGITLLNLNPATKYYYEFVAWFDSVNVITSNDGYSVTTAPAPQSPTITSWNVVNITGTSATVNFSGNAIGHTSAFYAEYALNTSPTFNLKTDTIYKNGQFTNENFQLVGLAPQSDYKIRLRTFAPNGEVTPTVTAVKYFTTLSSSKVEVTAMPASAVSQDSARLNGNVALGTSGSATYRFHLYNADTTLVQSFVPVVTSTSGNFFVNANGLLQDTMYLYRMTATDALGADTSNWQSFKTLQVPTPSISIDSIVGTANNLMVVYGKVNPNGNWNGSNTIVKALWGTTSALGNTTTVSGTYIGNQNYSFSVVIPVTAFNTQYFVRLIAENDGDGGISQTPIQTFTTRTGAQPAQASFDVYGGPGSIEYSVQVVGNSSVVRMLTRQQGSILTDTTLLGNSTGSTSYNNVKWGLGEYLTYDVWVHTTNLVDGTTALFGPKEVLTQPTGNPSVLIGDVFWTESPSQGVGLEIQLAGAGGGNIGNKLDLYVISDQGEFPTRTRNFTVGPTPYDTVIVVYGLVRPACGIIEARISKSNGSNAQNDLFSFCIEGDPVNSVHDISLIQEDAVYTVVNLLGQHVHTGTYNNFFSNRPERGLYIFKDFHSGHSMKISVQ